MKFSKSLEKTLEPVPDSVFDTFVMHSCLSPEDFLNNLRKNNVISSWTKCDEYDRKFVKELGLHIYRTQKSKSHQGNT